LQPYNITLFTIVSLNFLFYETLLLHRIPFRHAIILRFCYSIYFLFIHLSLPNLMLFLDIYISCRFWFLYFPLPDFLPPFQRIDTFFWIFTINPHFSYSSINFLMYLISSLLFVITAWLFANWSIYSIVLVTLSPFHDISVSITAKSIDSEEYLKYTTFLAPSSWWKIKLFLILNPLISCFWSWTLILIFQGFY